MLTITRDDKRWIFESVYKGYIIAFRFDSIWMYIIHIPHVVEKSYKLAFQHQKIYFTLLQR